MNIGLLGVGTIGTQLAATAHHFGMRVYAYAHQSKSCSDVDQCFHGDTLCMFAADLNYLVLSLPGTNATKGIVDAERYIEFVCAPATTFTRRRFS